MIVLLRKIKIDYTFLLLIAFSLISGCFIETICFLLSICFHEIGHIICSIIFKVRINRICLKIYGISANMDFKNTSYYKKILVYFSGIFFNFLLIVLFKFLNDFKYSDLIININYILIFLNSLLIYPLDGFNILISVLEENDLSAYKSNSFKISIIISLIFLFVFFIVSVYLKSFALIYIVLLLFFKNIKKIKNRDLELMRKILSLIT